MVSDLQSAWILATHFAFVSLFSVGGAHVVLPDIFRLIVTEQQWMQPAEFSQLVALSQAAPGPNVLVMAMLGYRVGGFPFAAIAAVAFILPPSVICYVAATVGSRSGGSTWKPLVKLALGPMTAGLVIASGFVLARGADAGWIGWAVTAAAAFVAGFTKVNPLLVIVAAGLVGIFL